MNGDPQSRFFAQFASLAKERLGRVQKALGSQEIAPPDIGRDLHALGDEAELLGLGDIVAVARDAEQAAANPGRESGSPEWKAKLLVSVGRVEAALVSAIRARSPRAAQADALREKFRAQFVASATSRHERVVRMLGRGAETNLLEVASELHTLGGEAAMLGANDIATLARIGEDAATREDRALLRHALDQLEVAIFAEDMPGGAS
jgi:HPt (histidine-containing phosphotransfer) domain-containing protein